MLVSPLNFPITDDYLRAFMFLFVRLVVTILTERISDSREMLRRSKEKFSSIEQSAFETIIAVDKKGKIIS
jgi:signal transduction histidine kinase